jgi:hypothetical protein
MAAANAAAITTALIMRFPQLPGAPGWIKITPILA